MKIATWNINSIRARLASIVKFIETHAPDVLCLQEIKVKDELFPIQAMLDLGFSYFVIRGEKSYNGLAIFSKYPLESHQFISFAGKQDSRHLSVTLPGDIELHNIYIPAGGDIPDHELNNKFAHKLRFIDELSDWFKENKKKDKKIILLGDFNVAPLKNDVWSHKQLLNVVSHTPIEVEKLLALQNSISFVDVVRKSVPESEKLYSWWSYRNHDWKTFNRGRRLDHIWVTKPLESQVRNSFIYTETRDYLSPSDHVPVVIDITL